MSPPVIPHPVGRLLRDSEAMKLKISNIISMEDYIRSEYRQGQDINFFRGIVYRVCPTSPYNRINQCRGVGSQGRLQDSPKKSALPSTCFRGSRRASRFITCGEITKNQVDDREHYVEQQVKQKCSHQHRNEAIKTKIIMKLCTKTA